MKLLLFIAAVFIASQCNAQSVLNEWHLNYSPKYKAGVGIDVGYEINNNVFRLNSVTYPSNSRTIPISVNASYGYSLLRIFQPFVLGGYFTTGNESVKEKEGSSGIEYGAGMLVMLLQKESYHIGLQIEAGSKITNLGLSFSSGLIIKFHLRN